MASISSPRPGQQPNRQNSTSTIDSRVVPVASPRPASQPEDPDTFATKRIVLPTRYTTLEPARPLSAFIDDPLFDTRASATILAVSYDQMRKWRERGLGPDYYQYGVGGSVRYALSALQAFKLKYLVFPKNMKGNK